MRKVLLLLLLLPLTALATNTPMSGVTVNPSGTPGDTDKTIDETGTNSYLQSYLNVAKYVQGKLTGDCSVNTSTFAITCTKINGLTFPALVNAECLTNNGTTLSWGTCGGGGGGGTFDTVGSGTNTSATMTCGTGCQVTHTGSGIVDSNYSNGTAIAANMATAGNGGVVSTNASAQWTTQNYLALPPVTYAAASAAVTCNSTNKGTLFFVTDSTVAAGGGTIAGSGSNKVLALCDGTNWVAH